MKIFVKINGEKEWYVLTFANRNIVDLDIAIDFAESTRLRCKLKLVDQDNTTLIKWSNI